MQTSEFTYTNNGQNLFFGMFSLGIFSYGLYKLGLPSSFSFDVRSIIHIIYYCVLLLFLFCGSYFLNTFRKLFGEKRKISISETYIIFPEYADSIKLIELNFSQISEVYFSQGRHGKPDNLIIKYDSDGHAYIGRDYLDSYDFEEICNLFKLRLGLKNIEMKNA